MTQAVRHPLTGFASGLPTTGRAREGQAGAGRPSGTEGRPRLPVTGAVAVPEDQLSLRNNVIATSTLSQRALRIAGHCLAQRSSVFQEYKCLGLWKSLLAT